MRPLLRRMRTGMQLKHSTTDETTPHYKRKLTGIFCLSLFIIIFYYKRINETN